MHSAPTLAMLACALVLAAPAGAQQMYKYVDSNGKVVYTDKIPAADAGRAAEELSRQGSVLKHIAPPPTPEERAALEEERKRKVEADIRAKEERRKNMALLNTYSSEADIDQARMRAMQANNEAIKDAEQKYADTQKRQQQLKTDAEFYQKKPLPGPLKRDIQANEFELRANADLLEVKRRETALIGAKYDDDKRRYVGLIKAGSTSGAAAGTRVSSSR